MQLITMQVLHGFTTFLLSALMSKLRIGGCLLALSLFQRISIHVVTAGWQLNQSWMAKMHPSTKATDLHLGICSSKYTQALLLKRFWLSRSKSLTGRPDEPNTWKIKLEVKTPTIGLSIATDRWERGWWQTSTQIPLHTACKTVPDVEKIVLQSYLQVSKPSVNSFSFLMLKWS